MPLNLHGQFFDSTAGRIVNLLRQGGSTVDELAAQLGVSQNAVRMQLTRMQRDGLVRRARVERRTTRPSQVFELTASTEQLLSRAYIPFLTQLVQLFASRLSAREFEGLMREAGRSLAGNFSTRVKPGSDLAERVAVASAVLNEEFGAVTAVERSDGGLVIRGHGCPLAAVTGKHPAVCLAVESLITELIHARVRVCCTRERPPRCCFEVNAHETRSGDARRRKAPARSHRRSD